MSTDADTCSLIDDFIAEPLTSAEPQTLSFRWRLSMAALAAGIVGVFGTAGWLSPDPRGFGTHQQLGLPACSFLEMTGIGCPHCGMTTSFSHIVRGQVISAIRANPSGPLLACLMAALVPWFLLVSVTGRWIGTRDPMIWFVRGLLGYLGVTLLMWLLRVVL